MADRKSEELNTVMSLYNDGKITVEERDALLARLGVSADDVDGKSAVDDDSNAVSDNSDVRSDTAADSGEKTDPCDDSDPFDTPPRSVDKNTSTADETPVSGFSELGGKISAAVKKGLSAANRALDKAGDTIKHIADDIRKDISSRREAVTKREEASSDRPYEELTITLRYVYAFGLKNLKERGNGAVERLKQNCRPVMDDEFYAVLCETLDTKFIGKFEYKKNGVSLCISVE